MDISVVLNEILQSQIDSPISKDFFEFLRFSNWQAANRNLIRIRENTRLHDPSAKVIINLLHALDLCADPETSLINFDRFFQDEKANVLIPILIQEPRLLEIFAKIFSASQFLTEILLRNPDFAFSMVNREAFSQRKKSMQIHLEAIQRVRENSSEDTAPDILRIFQREELLRIGTNDVLDYFDLNTVIDQLSNLADGLVGASLELAALETKNPVESFVVVALGKLGAQELNYSSDIDLLFLVEDDAQEKLVLGERLIDYLGKVTSQGFLYRVDMRLRPWGKDGYLISSEEGYYQYNVKNARLWEKQALLKARPIAGNISVGERILDRVREFVFDQDPEDVRSSVYAMKQKIEQILHQKGRIWGEVKLGEGSIRDIEFVVQFMQLAHGKDFADLRGRKTLEMLRNLGMRKLLSRDEVRTLSDGYVFLRTIEHFLQMMHYRQTDTLPSDSAALGSLARRLGFQGAFAGDLFRNRYDEHCLAIRSLFLKHIGSVTLVANNGEVFASPIVKKHLGRLDESYAEIFSPADILFHAELVEKINYETPSVVETHLNEDGTWQVTIVALDFPGELSIICGLFFVHGFNIIAGQVFTYEPLEGVERPISGSPATAGIGTVRKISERLDDKEKLDRSKDARQKIVDVFTVKPVIGGEPGQDIWNVYQQELSSYIEMLKRGQRREARGTLAKRVGAAFQSFNRKISPLYPIDIEIDNDANDRYSVLRIDAPDTVGFLYEFSNALAFARINIARMIVQSIGNRANDILFVTTYEGKKIVEIEQQRQLRASIVLVKHFTHLLPNSPNPETALLHFREFLGKLFQRPNWPDEIASFEKSNVLSSLARVLGVSDFLWDDFLRMQYANLYPVVRDIDALATAKPKNQLEIELSQVLETSNVGGNIYPDWRASLNAFKDRELFRIDMRHILGLTSEFWDFAKELTELAEVVIQAGLNFCEGEMQELYGLPIGETGSQTSLALFALGKCGGRELGFASDIELMFIYEGNGTTTGPTVIETSDYYERLVPSIINAIKARVEGIFQIDLQLRPYGKAGSMAVSLEAFNRYYAPEGPAWSYERQALVKLRQIAGDQQLGDKILKLRDLFVYESGPFDVTSMRAMRERQIRHLVTGGTFNAKFSPGGLVDVEYLVQGLQINYGKKLPQVRTTNLREAMTELHNGGVLSDDDFVRLRKAHTFLRWLIDSLRVVRGNSKDTTVPPPSSEEFEFLARRLLYGNNLEKLWDDMDRFVSDVQEINQRLLPS